MTKMEQPTYITPLMEQQMFDDWCPYNGNPDPRTVWAAATDAVNGLFLSMQQVSVPRVKVQLPDGDERAVKTWFTEMVNGELVVSISVDTKESELITNQPQPTWKAEQLDEYEIRVTSPEGESWRLRSADRNDSFNNFIWRWAQAMITKGVSND